MKHSLKFILSLAAALSFGAAASFAQSSTAVTHSGQAVSHAAAASGESVASAATAVSGVVAVPVWISGAAVQSGGVVLSKVGELSAAAGQATTKGAEQLWDAATGEPAKRPALDRHVGVPALKPEPPVPAKRAPDASPAEVLHTKV